MSDEPTNRDTIRAVTVWVILQLIATGLVVARVQFWNNANVGDRSALAIVIAIQIVAASMLVGVLMPNRWAALFVLLSTLPFVQLASLLAASSPLETLRAAALVVLWLGTMWVWSTVLRSEVSRALLSAAATATSLGAVLFSYLRIEFTPERMLPLNGLMRPLVLFVTSGAIALMVGHVARSRQVIHKNGG